MRAITSPVILTSLRSRSDGSLGLSFSTPELNSTEKAAWFDLQNKNCRLLLEPSDETAEAPIEVKGQLEQKTDSQRQRAILFLIHKASGAGGDFEAYYRARMAKNLEKLKDELHTLEA